MKYNGKEVTRDFLISIHSRVVQNTDKQYNPYFQDILDVLQAADEVFTENATHVQMIAVSDLTHTDLELERQAGHSEEWQDGFAAALRILGVEEEKE